jgi:hypothetical protein
MDADTCDGVCIETNLVSSVDIDHEDVVRAGVPSVELGVGDFD